MSFADISSMPISAIRIYLEKCPAVKAEQKLLNFEAYSAVWLDGFDRRGILDSWQRVAFGEVDIIKPTKKDLARIGIGTR